MSEILEVTAEAVSRMAYLQRVLPDACIRMNDNCLGACDWERFRDLCLTCPEAHEICAYDAEKRLNQQGGKA